MKKKKSQWLLKPMIVGVIAMLSPISFIAEANASACTTSTVNGSTVNGDSLWGEVPTVTGQVAATSCDIDQFSWNNFLYLTGDDGNGHPRFMSFAPWYKALPESGKSVWSGQYAPLQAAQMQSNRNHLQAGDAFHLLDVNGNTVTYDIRVNEDFVNYIADHGMYTTEAINKAVADYKNNNQSASAIWLPPTEKKSKKSVMEIKTSWRNYGSNQASCPADIMHCEQDSGGTWWGLIGLHLVQKTPNHGEMVWASFEHIANAPDCQAGGSNPIQKNPSGLTTGWNLFNYDSYTEAGGKGTDCSIPQTGVESPLCLTNPNPSGDNKTWVSINVCRSDQLPPAVNCDSASSDLAVTSCLNSNVQATLSNKWKNYQLIGAEWGSWGAAFGQVTPLIGCFNLYDGTGPGVGSLGSSCTNPAPTGENTMTIAGTTHLANTTMETWMQKGISLTTGQGKSAETWTQQDCFSCHQPPTASYQGDMSHLFGRAQQIGDVKAGPIFSNNAAKQICPNVCDKASGKWNGQWTTTEPGVMSVCGCVVKD